MKLMCDPFLICLFDKSYAEGEFEPYYKHFIKIFGTHKIVLIEFRKRESQISFENMQYLAKDFAHILADLETAEKRNSFRIPTSLPIEIISQCQKNKNAFKCNNISISGACISGGPIEGSSVEIIINRKFTGQGKICWQKVEKENHTYGIQLKLDDQEKFRTFLKKELIPEALEDHEKRLI